MFRNPSPLIFLLCIAGGVAGCASSGEQVALESELRNRESRIRDLERQLTESEQLIKDQDAELTALRDSPTPTGHLSATRLVSATAPAERLAAWGSVTGIRIHRLTSGIVPSEANVKPTINVVVQPIDEDGDLVKIAGKLRVTAQLVENETPGKQIAAIEYDLTGCRRIWQEGLVSSGLHATLRCIEELPEGALIQISASLDLGGERIFSGSETIGGN